MKLDDWIKNEIDRRWPGKGYAAYAQDEVDEVWRTLEPKAQLTVGQLPEAERLGLVMQMTAGHEGCINHLYIDTYGLATLGVGTMIDRENSSLLMRAPLTLNGRPATQAERQADVKACRALFKSKSSPPLAASYAAVTQCRISDAEAVEFAGSLLADFADKLFHPAYPRTYQHKEHYLGYPLFSWMVLVDMAFNLGNGKLNAFENLNKAIRNGDWKTAAKESLVRGVSYKTLATRYMLLKACDGFEPSADASEPQVDEQEPPAGASSAGEGVTIERVLDVPTLSQGNEANGDSSLWCGRTSASMVYNYYRSTLGQSDFIVNSVDSRDLIYPDGHRAAPGYNLFEPLERVKPGWRRVELYPKSQRAGSLDEERVRSVMQPLIDAIDNNNPSIAYTSLSRREQRACHIVVVSGYREKKGILWLHIDDPATMRFGPGRKGDFLGTHNVEILREGEWQATGCRYWLRARRLLEPNDHTREPDDLWCDHADRPGFAVIYNPQRTPDSPHVRTLRTARVALPVDLGIGHDVTDDNVAGYHEHIEVESAGGYFPVGANSVWHGGVHIRGQAGTIVAAVADGEIVAARLPGDDRAVGAYGSSNFVLVRHGVRGSTLNAMSAQPRRIGFRLTASRNIRSAAATGGDTVVGLLRNGDALKLLSPDSISAGGHVWYRVEVLRASQADLVGKSGYVAHSHSAFEDVYSSTGSVFTDSKVYDWYSLYVHLAPLALTPDSAELADIPWIMREVRLESTGPADDATISGSVGAQGRNLPTDVRTVQTLLNAAGHACGSADGLVGSKTIAAIRGFQGGFLAHPDGRIDAGGKSWRNLLAATGAGEADAALEVDAELLAELDGGQVVAIGRRVRAGEKLWLMGEHGSEGSRAHMLHLEVFSGDNLMPAWKEIVDEDGDFNMDSKAILQLIEQDSGWFADDDVVSAEEVRRFYANDHDAASLRHTVCKFVSEWAVDLDVAIDRMKGRWFTYGLREKLEPYIFYPDIEGAAEVPPPVHYHYNPVAFLEALSSKSPMGARPSDPAVTQIETSGATGADPSRPDSETPALGTLHLVRRNGESVPHFCQADPAWGERALGSGSSLRSRGCAVTGLAMILKYYGRVSVTPGTLDGWLDIKGGYAGNAVKWHVAMKHEEGVGDGPQLEYKGRVSQNIDATLLARLHDNRATLARVDYLGDAGDDYDHFVVIIGRDAAGNYIMNDPGYADGNGVADPEDNVVQATRRKGGYRIVELDIIDPVGDTEPPSVQDDDPLPEPVGPAPESGSHYGGFMLQCGDRDSTRLWGGAARATVGTFVAELQRDLVVLGHWISNPKCLSGRGMLVDGIFGQRVRGAVYLFQRENGLPETGKVDPATAAKIHQKIQGDSSRSGHAPRKVPGATFYQLPPSTGYARYGDIAVSSTGFVTDCWGTKEMIECIRKAANDWQSLGRDPFLVGDVSLYDGGYFHPHKTHQDGQGADIDSDRWCSINRATFDKVESLQLARVFVKHGAKRILFNCKYVIDKCPEVKSCGSHHHHFHVDVVDKPIGQPKPAVECKHCHPDVHASCDYAGKRARS